MVFGYCRVSTEQQNLERQLDLLRKYTCDEILTEKMTGTKSDRPVLNLLKEKIREGDIIIIESLTRLGRSTKDLIELVEYFNSKGVNLISLKEHLDSTTATGKAMIGMLSVMAQFERDLIAERTREGLKSARARGRVGGRPKKDEKAINKAIKLYDSQEYSIKEIVDMTSISQATLYRRIKERKI
ncbi:recombinase family protein [Desulfosporosinus nitroreducens]|uniref:Recombinase family protein n=1 Tax=Desulfosporosinus nitroreducens TaxID=2018668 RepID=A0ABT8QXC6_9FIRM|nr:recombinase family protein [Desulfosporosinus nitroreducens]MDO0825996.1 recombinase family protein [Desulfosporosinus nitroreducens]